MKQWSPICLLMIKLGMYVHIAIDVDAAIDKNIENIAVEVG